MVDNRFFLQGFHRDHVHAGHTKNEVTGLQATGIPPSVAVEHGLKHFCEKVEEKLQRIRTELRQQVYYVLNFIQNYLQTNWRVNMLVG